MKYRFNLLLVLPFAGIVGCSAAAPDAATCSVVASAEGTRVLRCTDGLTINIVDGISGANGKDGVAGARALVKATAVGIVPAGASVTCPGSAVRIDSGTDDGAGEHAGNNTLDDDEVASTQYVCNGVVGAAAHEPLLVMADASAHCPAGGQGLSVGLDADSDGVLDPEEITATQYVCNGADGAAAAVSVEPPGDVCPAGGVKVALGGGEPTYVCDGVAGQDGLDGASGQAGANGANAVVTAEPVGDTCPAGGVKVEVEGAAAAYYVCSGVNGTNGVNGQDGTNGADGTSTDGMSAVVTSEPAGSNCPVGGVRVQVGSGSPSYVCNGAAGATGATGDSATVAGEPPGSNCPTGGVRLRVGNGASMYVCNGINGATGAAGTAGQNGTAGTSVVSTTEPAGAHCATGGVKLTVSAGTPTYVCNGTSGTDGTNGTNGTNGVSPSVTAEPVGGNCASGGLKVQVEAGPVSYICNGTNGSAGANGSPGEPGANGSPGEPGVDGTSCTITTVNFVTKLACTDGTFVVLDTKYGVGGQVSGLAGSVVLKNNGSDPLTVSENGGFTFSAGLLNGGGYSVSVFTQPATQTCSVTGNGSGTIASASVTNVAVACACNTGLLDCDTSAANGCEISKLTDNANCGACGNACATDQTCKDGACSSPASQCNPYANGGYYRVSRPEGMVDYATIDCTLPTTAIGGCQVGKWKVPAGGWQIVSPGDTWLVPYVLQAGLNFGTSVLVISDGNGLVTPGYAAVSGRPAGSILGGGFFVDDGTGGYSVSACAARIAIKRWP